MIDAALMKALADPAFYPHKPESVEVCQTHISVVALAGPLVYKIKKPVDFGFCDFTTLEKRHHFCREEVRLNRRLAPDVYRRVVPIVRLPDGRFTLDGEGEPAEYAVEMRRLPADRMLPELLGEGKVTAEDVAAIAHVVNGFHASAARSEAVDAHGRLEVIEAEVRQNFLQLEPFVGRTIEPEAYELLKERTERFLATHHDLFSQRISDGRIVEGHGDLHADHICLEPTGTVIYDCIEFNTAFRCLDIASEVAFLTMDLDYLGYSEISDAFALRYRALAEDPLLPRMLPFYQSYRAVVRGKVESFRLDDVDIPEAAKAKAKVSARRYLELACLYAQSFDLPTLIILCGLIGSGKSTLAKALASNLDGVVLSSDVVRKELAGIPSAVHQFEPYGAGLYDQETKERTYAALLEQAHSLLEAGRTVILDASFSKRTYRDQARLLAAEAKADVWCCWCQCEHDELDRRLQERTDEDKGPSDARQEILKPFKAAFQAPDEWPSETLIVIDTDLPLATCTSQVLEKLRPRFQLLTVVGANSDQLEWKGGPGCVNKSDA
jgi:aminoglycoside phosphotransferase family enzyme/predicted kinase